MSALCWPVAQWARGQEICAWCGDYRRQHKGGEGPCRMCHREPWERGEYRCLAFVEKKPDA